jgi:hypothetical protein
MKPANSPDIKWTSSSLYLDILDWFINKNFYANSNIIIIYYHKCTIHSSWEQA